MNYVPFLKLKQNELGALHALDEGYVDSVCPLLDMPRSQNMDEDEYINKISSSKRQLGRFLDKDKPFYLDVFDINPLLKPGGLHPYEYALLELIDYNIYPIVGLDRDPEHIISAEGYLSSTENHESKHVGIRLLKQDIEHYVISEKGIKDLCRTFNKYTKYIDIIIDLRSVFNQDINELAVQAIDFVGQLKSEIDVNNIIFTCCALPSSISEVVKTEHTAVLLRSEKAFFEIIKSAIPDAIYGDYTIVSPEYTDIPIELFSRVSAPKIIYTCDDNYFMARGGAFRTHPRKYAQYYDLAQVVFDHSEFRGAGYSYGEDYVIEKKDRKGGSGSPSSWLKAMINSHITFILELGF